ncbi:hypothetical protein WT63_09235 [Burkholderia anthina]|nr:hypothetical protein WT63_09235 [Burkholderia anthina]
MLRFDIEKKFGDAGGDFRTDVSSEIRLRSKSGFVMADLAREDGRAYINEGHVVTPPGRADYALNGRTARMVGTFHSQRVFTPHMDETQHVAESSERF